MKTTRTPEELIVLQNEMDKEVARVHEMIQFGSLDSFSLAMASGLITRIRQEVKSYNISGVEFCISKLKEIK